MLISKSARADTLWDERDFSRAIKPPITQRDLHGSLSYNVRGTLYVHQYRQSVSPRAYLSAANNINISSRRSPDHVKLK